MMLIFDRSTYTRPEVYIHKKKKYSVPEVLLNGNHKDIEASRSKS
jgi:tRNA G37 N-methylase TrmD